MRFTTGSAVVIVNLSLLAGRFGYENRSPNATARWGIIGFTKTCSIELGKYSIRANAVLPGAVAETRIERGIRGKSGCEWHHLGTGKGKRQDDSRADAAN
ncbi:SDR family oxidoreductase [Pontibacter indicus]|uniref:SDR family oxidoreductase n=1 Tax=Pontibacter indicus TaxID=1317125 RepID=UPI0009FB4F5F